VTAPHIVGIGSLYAIERDGTITPAGLAADVALAAVARGARGIAASRVGFDRFGTEVVDALRTATVDVTAIQTDSDLATPRRVTRGSTHRLDPYGAFDSMQWDSDLEALGRRAEVIVTDALSRRHGQSRSTIDRLLIAATTSLRVIDLVARPPLAADADRLDREFVGNALELCDIFLVDAVALRALVPAIADAIEAAKRSAALMQRATVVLLPTSASAGAVATTRSCEVIPPSADAARPPGDRSSTSGSLATTIAMAALEGRSIAEALAHA